MEEVRRRFEEESSVKLRDFLADERRDEIGRSSIAEDERDGLGRDRPSLDYEVGINERWRAAGGGARAQAAIPAPAPREPSSSRSANGADSDTGIGLHRLRRDLFSSAAFGRWLGRVTGLAVPLGGRGAVRRFRPGLDYTVAHHGMLAPKPVLDATLCFCAGTGRQCRYDESTGELLGTDDDAVWESGDVGGFECYIAADEDDDDRGPEAEYDEEDDTELLSVSASNNTLSLVYRDPGTMRFVKYVGAGAPGSRWDVALEYDVNDVEDGDAEVGADEDEEAGADDYDKDEDDTRSRIDDFEMPIAKPFSMRFCFGENLF
ncbi:LOW QUALITY PROTEIN: hypothetical protein ACHAWF_006988 [Thalassiosira exigua]